jgi:hypothetical protein
VGEAALKSSNYPTGIVLLEKMLNKMSEMDIKKGKKAQQLEEQPKEVADLWNHVCLLAFFFDSYSSCVLDGRWA